MKVSVQEQDFDLSAETRLLSKDNRVGAIASFVGVVREVPMTLEHYPGMTENAIRKIAEQAGTRWQVMDCTVIHRYGALQEMRAQCADGRDAAWHLDLFARGAELLAQAGEEQDFHFQR